MDRQRVMMRNVGFLVALSTPITAFIAFALASIIIGEEELEGSSGTTALGYFVMALPLIIGVAIAAWAHLGGATPSIQHVAAGLGGFGLLCTAVGIASVLASDGDASIGGGLLVLFGLALVGAAFIATIVARRQPTPPPPPAAQ